MHVGRDLVIIGTDVSTGHIYAFEAATGKVAWKRPAGRGVATDILASGGSIYALTLDGDVLRLDAATGKEVWSYKAGAPATMATTFASPALGGGRLFVPAAEAGVVALDAATGGLLWVRLLPASPSSSILLSEGALYVGAEDQHLYRLDPRTGEITARLALGLTPRRTLTAAGSLILAFLADNDRGTRLVAVDRDLRGVRWERPPPDGSQWTSLEPFVRRHLVLAGGINGEVIAYRLADGSAAWRADVRGVVKVFSAAADLLLVGTEAGGLYSFRLDGAQQER